MNKTELVETIAQRTDLSKKDVVLLFRLHVSHAVDEMATNEIKPPNIRNDVIVVIGDVFRLQKLNFRRCLARPFHLETSDGVCLGG